MAIKCPICQHDNPPGTKYCGKCGDQLHREGPIGTSAPTSGDIPVSHTKTLETPVEELTRGTIFAGRYEIIEELGKGGMGRVYRVEDKKLKQEVALKLIKPEIASDEKIIERFRNELKTARMIAHKNVCRMFDLGEAQGSHFITMEYIPGEDLKSFIRRSGLISVGKAIAIANQVCEGLSEAHRLGVVHRDLKPQNIMIDKEGNARIMDFGIARSLRAKGITGAGVMIGTPEYMSPEQVEGKEVDQRSDIYSLGVILYEMVTGQVPFEGDTPFSIGVKHKSEIPKDPKEVNSQIPEDLSLVILKCLEKDREKRCQIAEELLSELSKIEETKPETIKIPEWKNSIAVLPFKNMSADPEQEYFCEGLSEELINSLSQIKDIRVVARTSAFSFKGKDVDIREIGKKLNVETVLEGSVRQAGNRLRITAQLINVADGYHLWSERFDRELVDVFAIQDEISLAITDKMKLELLGQEKEKIVKRYTEDLEAYNLYLKGLYFRRMLSADHVNKGIEYFNLAIEKDPDFALAYAGLAYAYMVLSFYAPVLPKENYQKAKQAAFKALELDDQLAEAYESLTIVSGYLEGDWERAEREIKRAIELKPGYAWAHFHHAMILMYQARFDEAIKKMHWVLELDPLNVAFNRNLGVGYFRAGQLENAIEILQRTIDMDPTFPVTHLYLAYCYMQKSMYEKALAQMQKESLPKSMLDPQIGIVYARMGRREEALQILNKYMSQSNKEFIHHYGLAYLCFALEENDLGFRRLEKAYEVRDPWVVSIKIDFLLDSVRTDPRFKALLKKMNLE